MTGDAGERSTALQGHELVVHVFVAVDAERADHRYLTDLWNRCVERFALDESVPGYSVEPGELPGPDVDQAVLAARAGAPGDGPCQVVLRRAATVLCLSLACAPGPPWGWPELEAAWESVYGSPTRGVLGTVRILQARLADPVAVPDPGELAPVVAAASGVDGDWSGRGVLRVERPLGPFVVWEVTGNADLDAPGVALTHDGRPDRTLVVVAPADHDPLLSAWTWSRGTGELTSLARYLLQAAIMRYELRVWTAARPGAALRRDAEDVVGAARTALTDGAADDVLRVRLKALGGEEQRLIQRRARLEELRGVAAAAGRNMARHVPDRPSGPFADDRDLGAWFDRQLGVELDRLDTTLERITSALVDGGHSAGGPRDIRREPDQRALGLGADPRVLERVLNRAAGFQDVFLFAAGLEREAARVCTVELIRPSGTARGTGFLVGPDLVLTNHHVVDALIAGGAPPNRVRCTFGFRVSGDGALVPGVPVGLAAEDWLVAARPHSPVDLLADPSALPAPDELDYVILRLATAPGLQPGPDGTPRGWLDLRAVTGVPVVGAPLLILQHPDGEPAKVALDTDGVLAVNEDGTRLSYGVNTLSGSSGAPCFTFDLVPVAVHHSGAAEFDAGRNEGIPLVAIVADLQEQGVRLPDPLCGADPSESRTTEEGRL